MTSLLKRSTRTLWLILEEMDLMHLPVKTDWRLNERHYGALQGLDKEETAVLGAAMLGGIAAGFYRDHDEAVKAAAASPTHTFTPQPEIHRKYEKGYEIFCNLYPQLKIPFDSLAAGD